MVKPHRELKPPKWNTIIWKYMPLEMFLYLLFEKKLFFTNATGFSDKYEGVVPPRTQAYMSDHWAELVKGIVGPPIAFNEHLENTHARMRDFWVSCWSISRDESYALWKIYLRGSRAGVAIRTNVKNLSDALNKASGPSAPDVYMSRVSYSGYIKPEELSPWQILINKARHYSYEREMRLILNPNWNDPQMMHLADRRGTGVPVDLNVLVDHIYVSPFVGSWFRQIVEKVIAVQEPSLSMRIVNSIVRDE